MAAPDVNPVGYGQSAPNAAAIPPAASAAGAQLRALWAQREKAAAAGVPSATSKSLAPTARPEVAQTRAMWSEREEKTAGAGDIEVQDNAKLQKRVEVWAAHGLKNKSDQVGPQLNLPNTSPDIPVVQTLILDGRKTTVHWTDDANVRRQRLGLPPIPKKPPVAPQPSTHQIRNLGDSAGTSAVNAPVVNLSDHVASGERGDDIPDPVGVAHNVSLAASSAALSELDSHVESAAATVVHGHDIQGIGIARAIDDLIARHGVAPAPAAISGVAIPVPSTTSFVSPAFAIAVQEGDAVLPTPSATSSLKAYAIPPSVQQQGITIAAPLFEVASVVEQFSEEHTETVSMVVPIISEKFVSDPAEVAPRMHVAAPTVEISSPAVTEALAEMLVRSNAAVAASTAAYVEDAGLNVSVAAPAFIDRSRIAGEVGHDVLAHMQLAAQSAVVSSGNRFGTDGVAVYNASLPFSHVSYVPEEDAIFHAHEPLSGSGLMDSNLGMATMRSQPVFGNSFLSAPGNLNGFGVNHSAVRRIAGIFHGRQPSTAPIGEAAFISSVVQPVYSSSFPPAMRVGSSSGSLAHSLPFQSLAMVPVAPYPFQNVLNIGRLSWEVFEDHSRMLHAGDAPGKRKGLADIAGVHKKRRNTSLTDDSEGLDNAQPVAVRNDSMINPFAMPTWINLGAWMLDKVGLRNKSTQGHSGSVVDVASQRVNSKGEGNNGSGASQHNAQSGQPAATAQGNKGAGQAYMEGATASGYPTANPLAMPMAGFNRDAAVAITATAALASAAMYNAAATLVATIAGRMALMRENPFAVGYKFTPSSLPNVLDTNMAINLFVFHAFEEHPSTRRLIPSWMVLPTDTKSFNERRHKSPSEKDPALPSLEYYLQRLLESTPDSPVSLQQCLKFVREVERQIEMVEKYRDIFLGTGFFIWRDTVARLYVKWIAAIEKMLDKQLSNLPMSKLVDAFYNWTPVIYDMANTLYALYKLNVTKHGDTPLSMEKIGVTFHQIRRVVEQSRLVDMTQKPHMVNLPKAVTAGQHEYSLRKSVGERLPAVLAPAAAAAA